MAATPPPGGSRAYDGRLDPEDLDRAIGLDLVDHGRGTAPDPHEHEPTSRGPLRFAAVLAAVVVGGAVVVAVTREDPPPPLPGVAVAAGSADDVRAETDPATRAVRSLSRLVVVTTRGDGDVEVTTLGVRGPGLADEYAGVPVVTSGSARTGPVGAEVVCSEESEVDGVLAASPGDYRVAVVRRSPDGRSDETTVGLPGADGWLDAVRAACVQTAARRGLRVIGAAATPLPGAAATDVVLTVRNSSGRQWADLRLVADERRAVAPTGDRLDLPPGATGDLHAVVWSRDCADPLADLDRGIVVEAGVTRTDGAGFVPLSEFRLDPGPEVLAPVAAALTSQCSGTPPRLSVAWAKVRGGAQGDSAGVLEIAADVRVPATSVSVGPVGDESGQGRVTPAEPSWPVRDGRATATLRWELPSCLSLLTQGAVRLPVRVYDGDTERRYLVALRGELIQVPLARLCGPTVASIAR